MKTCTVRVYTFKPETSTYGISVPQHRYWVVPYPLAPVYTNLWIKDRTVNDLHKNTWFDSQRRNQFYVFVFSAKS